METTTTTNDSNLFDLQLDPRAQMFLAETAKWAKFIAIVSFCFLGLFLLGIIGAGAVMSGSGGAFRDSDLQMIGGGAIVVIGLITIVLILIPNIYLLRFGMKMQSALRNNDQPTLLAAFSNVKSYFKFIGILYIVVIALWVLAYISKAFR